MSAPTTRIAVFASGRGTNFSSILEAVKSGALSAEIVALVSDNPAAPVIDKAEKNGIRTIVHAPDRAARDDAGRRRHEEAILSELRSLKPEYLVLAGYMRLLTPALIAEFRSPNGTSRIVNIHPSLLPAFPGVGSYAQAYDYGSKVAGATVHLVDTGLDTGPICAQEAFDISGCKSIEEVERLGLALEHRLYPETLRWILAGRFTVSSRLQGRVCVSPN